MTYSVKHQILKNIPVSAISFLKTELQQAMQSIQIEETADLDAATNKIDGLKNLITIHYTSNEIFRELIELLNMVTTASLIVYSKKLNQSYNYNNH